MGMEGVGIIGSIVIGILAGWLAERFTKSNHGLLTNLVLGVLGAVLAGWVAGRMNFIVDGWIDNLIGATIGAIVLILAYRTIRKA